LTILVYLAESEKALRASNIRSTKFIKVDGNPPARLVVLKFDSAEKARAFLNTPVQKEITAARINPTNSLEFIVEGFSN
jgi:uncharacterized protein (DUF1330 family)